MKLVEGRGYETYNTEKVKRERKEEFEKSAGGCRWRTKEGNAVEEEDAPVPRVTHVNNFLDSIF